MKNKINIACGPIFLDNNDWLNIDYVPATSAIQKVDLLNKFPFEDSSFTVVYSSHFFEHIPYAQASYFLSNCYKIMASGGILRLVIPDFQSATQQYLLMREVGDHEKANFLITLIGDQCVRSERGGELFKLYSKYRSNPEHYTEMLNFITYCTGGEYIKSSVKDEKSLSARAPFWSSKYWIRRLFSRLEFAWILAVTGLLPKTFRNQNVSLTTIGERHQWLWDYEQLKDMLEEVGFKDVRKKEYNSSSIPDFPFYPLDMNNQDLPRKGFLSIYIEATK